MAQSTTIREFALWRRGAGALLALGLLLAGCAEPVRQIVNRPFIDAPVSAETIFGEATIGDNRSMAAIENIKVPDLPSDGPLTLDECLTLAKKVSPSLDTADQAYLGAMWSRWQAIAAFLPTAGSATPPLAATIPSAPIPAATNTPSAPK